MKKLMLSLVALLLVCASLFTLTACLGNTPTTDENGNPVTTTKPNGSEIVAPGSQMNVKFFKVGKSNATLIRSGDIAILIDTGDDNDEDPVDGKQDDGVKILTYLAEKGVTELDMIIVSQFNKKHYGALDTILGGVTVKEIYEPSYAKTGASYDAYRAALTKANITPKVIKEETALKAGDLNLTVYPAKSTTSAADQDEYYSLAIAVDGPGMDVLIASDIYGARVNEVITALKGKTFDILQVPKHGAFNGEVETLIDAVKPKYAVIFASANNPADARTVNLLAEKKITTYITKDGSVEAKYKNNALTVKQ